ncbi:MAG: thiamine pyrophosphate-binding protein [Betaproteobacteria bacterium]|nr:thiamine pyrophosphate-binding protein [Betaproteobacteria bacterium]
MNCSQVIAKYVKAAGITHIFGYPGDPNVEFLEAARREGVQFVLGRREGTAGFMAQAYGFLTGMPGMCMSTLGPGSSNLVNPVANAYLDKVPMIALSGQIETARDGVFTHQVLNHNALFSPISKWAVQVQRNNVGKVMRKALRVAAAERPGPVHITMPADLAGAECTDTDVVLPPLRAVAHGFQVFADGKSTVDVVARLKKARRPVVLAGTSAQRAGATKALTRFMEALGCPVVVAPMAKGVVPEDHPFYAGTVDMACNGFMWDFLKSCDLVLAVGFDPVELIKPWQLSAPTIHIDSTPNTDQVYAAETEIVGPIADVLAALASAYRGEPKWREKQIAQHRKRLFALYYSGRVKGKLNPTDVVDAVREAMPKNTVVSTDVGSHKLLVGLGWTAYRPRSVLMTNGLSTMGYSLPAAIVSSLLAPKDPAVCFIGDGSLAMVQSELRLASSLKAGVIVVVFCDNSLNRIELKQAARKYPSWGTLIDPTDMVGLARSMDCEGFRVSSARQLERVLADNRPRGRPLVIGAVIDPAQYQAQF